MNRRTVYANIFSCPACHACHGAGQPITLTRTDDGWTFECHACRRQYFDRNENRSTYKDTTWGSHTFMVFIRERAEDATNARTKQHS